MIAALFVQADGCYSKIEGVDVWPEARDARRYAGPHAIVGHPPCQRWSKFWFGSTSPKSPKRYLKGDDGGCFAAALASVRRWSGVLEHPAGSYAWAAFGLRHPPMAGGWVMADDCGGWTCRVDQAHFGHRAQKPTWLYANGVALPSLPWARVLTPDPDGRTRRGVLALMGHRERDATPPAFRDLLLSIARTARANKEAPNGNL